MEGFGGLASHIPDFWEGEVAYICFCQPFMLVPRAQALEEHTGAPLYATCHLLPIEQSSRQWVQKGHATQPLPSKCLFLLGACRAEALHEPVWQPSTASLCWKKAVETNQFPCPQGWSLWHPGHNLSKVPERLPLPLCKALPCPLPSILEHFPFLGIFISRAEGCAGTNSHRGQIIVVGKEKRMRLPLLPLM